MHFLAQSEHENARNAVEGSLNGLSFLINVARLVRKEVNPPRSVELLSHDGKPTGVKAEVADGVWRIVAEDFQEAQRQLDAKDAHGYGGMIDVVRVAQSFLGAMGQEPGRIAALRLANSVRWPENPISLLHQVEELAPALPDSAFGAVLGHKVDLWNVNFSPVAALDAHLTRHERDMPKYVRTWLEIWATVAVERGIDMNAPTAAPGNPTPLGALAGTRDTDRAAGLVARGADPNVPMPNGLTPVLAAFEACDDGMVRFLAEQGANLDARFHDGSTMLHRLADQLGHWQEETILSMSLALTEGGASLDVEDIGGRTPADRLEQKADFMRRGVIVPPNDWDFVYGDFRELLAGNPLPEAGAPGP